MTSLGAEAYCDTLTADTINYKHLNPVITGFVANPLTSDLQADNHSVGTATSKVSTLFAQTIDYVNLNPPINAGITNPLASDILGAGFNVGTPGSLVNIFQGTSGVFSSSTSTTCTTDNLTATASAVLPSGTTSGSLLVSPGNLVVDLGTITAKSLTSSGPGGFVNSGSGGLINQGSGGVELQGSGAVSLNSGDMTLTSGDLTLTSGNLTATAGQITGATLASASTIVASSSISAATTIFATQSITSSTTLNGIGGVISGANITASTGDISGVNLVASSDISGDTLTLNHIDIGTPNTSIGSPTNPNIVPVTIFDITNKSKGAWWVYNGQTNFSMDIECGVVNPCENCTFIVSVANATGFAPVPFLEKYYIAPDVSVPPTGIVLDLFFDIPIDQIRPVRVSVIMVRD